MCCLDYQLRFAPDIGGLKHFQVGAPVGQLAPHEKRYFLPVADLDRDVIRVSGRMTHRSCIDNSETGSRLQLLS